MRLNPPPAPVYLVYPARVLHSHLYGSLLFACSLCVGDKGENQVTLSAENAVGKQ